MKIIVADTNEQLTAALAPRLEGIRAVVRTADIFTFNADGIVSPANSFGFMDGGIDALYTQRFGMEIQCRLQQLIRAYFDGELLVGQAVAARTNYPGFPFLISAPTMRIPSVILDPTAIRLAARAAVRVAIKEGLGSLAMPGMGTGCGEVDPEIAARQMAAGIHDALSPAPFPVSWQEASTS